MITIMVVVTRMIITQNWKDKFKLWWEDWSGEMWVQHKQ